MTDKEALKKLISQTVDEMDGGQKKNRLFANFRDAKMIGVLKIEVNEGEGTLDDPVCRTTYLVSKSGKVLAKLNETVDREFAGEDEMYPIE